MRTLKVGRGRGAVDEEQLEALTKIVGSGRVVDVLVGPAGAGKTSAMSALRQAWEEEHGAGSVIGLAPSAAAAHVLAEDLGIPTENLAKWWHDHLRNGTTFRSGQLVIVDEASLAGTLHLDTSRPRSLPVGERRSCSSAILRSSNPSRPAARSRCSSTIDPMPRSSLRCIASSTSGRRLRHWHCATAIPRRSTSTLAHARVLEGSTEAMADAAYLAWRADARAGKASVLISESNEAVSRLNVRARTELILEGRVDALREAELHDGTAASVGDTVITRRNDRRLRAGRRWVRNGDRWTVASVRRDGGLEVRRPERTWRGTVVLPAAYVRRHVELGYAVTAHRAQGITTDTSHVVVASGTTRENLYVAMTRGRESNIAYVAIDRPDVSHIGPRPGDAEKPTARSVLYGVLQHVGAELSAHETLAGEQDAWGSIAQLAAEYETIAAAAQRGRWAQLVRGCGLHPDQAEAAIESDAFGPLTAELRRAEAEHFDIEQLLSSTVRARGFDDAQDVAAVLRARVAAATAHGVGGRAGPSGTAPRLIAGLIPPVIGEIDPDSRRALEERRALIEARADAILDQALRAKAPWTRALGVPPRGAAEVWRRHALTVAAYRDRYGVTGTHAVGPEPQSEVQRADAARARRALGIARRLSDQARGLDRPMPSVPTALPSVGPAF